MSKKLRSVPRVILLSALAFLGCHQFLATDAQEAPAQIEIAGRRVVMWKPAGLAPANGYPLILFSHGFTGCGTQSVFLTDALAQNGYFVLAPNHRDAMCGGGARDEATLFANLTSTRSEARFGRPDAWTEETYRNRRDDLEAILDTVVKQKAFEGVPIDLRHIGLAGHSLGGYTVLALAGAWPSWKDQRIKAVLALSPYCQPFIKKGNLGHLDVPIMYQGGTRDFGITPWIRRPGGAYELSSAPKYYVELDGAGHFAWTNLNKSYQSVINAYSVAFFDSYLKGTTKPERLAHLLDRPWPERVSEFKYEVQ